jgi:type IV secretion system protein TrbL
MIRRLVAVAATTAVLTVAGTSVALVPPAEAQVADVKCLITPALCVAGELVGDAAGAAVLSAVDGAARAFGEAAAWVIREVFGWWLRTPSVSIESSGVLQLQGIMLGLAALVGVALVTIQGIRMMVTRKGTPLAELIQGWFIAALITTVGVAVVDAALIAGDELAEWILTRGFASTDELVDRMVSVLFGPSVTTSAGLLFVFALVVMLVGLVQAILLFLRQAAIPLLALMFPIVAVGQLGPAGTRKWLPMVAAAVVAIVLYKPLVALILAAGFTQLSSGDSLVDVVRGFVTLALSVIALPAMLRIFSPIAGNVAASVGAGSGLLAAGAGVAAVMSLRGSGTPGDTSAVQHAAFMSAGQGSPGSGRSGGGNGGSPTSPSPASGGTAAAQAASANTPPTGSGAPTATAATTTSATAVGVPTAVALKGAEVGKAAARAAGEQVSGGSESR